MLPNDLVYVQFPLPELQAEAREFVSLLSQQAALPWLDNEEYTPEYEQTSYVG